MLAKRRSNADMEGPSSIEVLRSRELSHEYQCCDYLGNDSVVSTDTRMEMLEWVEQVSVYLKFSHNVSFATASLLDRFCQTDKGQAVLNYLPDFRLATMSCLYITAKLHDPNVVVSSEAMSAFSKGMFSAKQVEAMELDILVSMNWRVHPPTALEFVTEFLMLLPCSISQDTKRKAYDHCQTHLQRSIYDYEAFCLTEASMMAFFAVQNALRSIGVDSIILGHIVSIMSYATHTDYYSQPEKEALIQTCLMSPPGPETMVCGKGKRKNSSKHRRSSNNHVHKRERRMSSRSSTGSLSRQSWSRRSSSASLSNSPCGVVQVH